MTDRENLRELARRRLADTTDPVHWSDLQLNQWINDAIADYSVYFPRLLTYELKLVADQYEYSLAGLTNPWHIVRVEYPVSDDPPSYLTRRRVTDKRGFRGGYYYDVLGTPPATLVIANGDWATNDDCVVTYEADHAYLDEDTDTCTVPELHLELILLFVRMAALQEEAARETQDPRTNTLILGTLGLNAGRAEREYRAKLGEFLRQTGMTAQVAGWAMPDGGDRVY